MKTVEGAIIDELAGVRNKIVEFLFLPEITKKQKAEFSSVLRSFNSFIQQHDIKKAIDVYPPEIARAVDDCLISVENCCFKHTTEAEHVTAAQIRGFGITFKDPNFTKKIFYYQAVAPTLPVFTKKPIHFDQMVSGFFALLWQWKAKRKK